MSLLTNERYESYQTGFSFSRLGHAQGVGLGVPLMVGVKKYFFSKIQLHLVNYLHEWHIMTCNGTIMGVPAPGAFGRGQKVKYHVISTTTLKIFKPNCVCLLSFGRLGHACPRVWHLRVLGVKNLIF